MELLNNCGLGCSCGEELRLIDNNRRGRRRKRSMRSMSLDDSHWRRLYSDSSNNRNGRLAQGSHRLISNSPTNVHWRTSIVKGLLVQLEKSCLVLIDYLIGWFRKGSELLQGLYRRAWDVHFDISLDCGCFLEQNQSLGRVDTPENNRFGDHKRLDKLRGCHWMSLHGLTRGPF